METHRLSAACKRLGYLLFHIEHSAFSHILRQCFEYPNPLASPTAGQCGLFKRAVETDVGC